MRTVLRTLLAWLFLFAAPAALAQDSVVRLSVEPQFDQVYPGEQFAVAVILDIEPGWHIWPPESRGQVPPGLEGLAPAWTVVRGGDTAPGAGDAVIAGRLTAHFAHAQWPQPHVVTTAGITGRPIEFLSYEDRAIVFVPVIAAEDARPGPRTLEFIAEAQACDDRQCLPSDTLAASATIEVIPRDAARNGAPKPIFAAFDQSVFARIDGGTSEPPAIPDLPQANGVSRDTGAVPIDFLGYFFDVPPWAIWVVAFLAGLIMNLTPCVLPVVPIKVLSLQQHAKDPGKLALYGTVYCIGIVAFFAVLAALVAVVGQAWGQLNGYWWFSVPLAIIVAAMGLSMIGLFTFRLPQSVYMLSPSADTLSGNFLLGALTAVLSTPCTGPMLGSVLGWSFTQPRAVAVGSVLVMGLGMASPYALLIAFPRLIDRVPRTGPGSELLKQVLGLLMLSVAAYILSFLTTGSWTWWLVGLLAGAAFTWMYIGGLRVLKGINAKIIVTHSAILGLIITAAMTRSMTAKAQPAPAGGASAWSAQGAIPWRVFSASEHGDIGSAVNAALAAGKVVVVDFTAKWCINCHLIERTILNSETGRRLLTHDAVVPIKVDITHSSYEDGREVLKEFSGAASIPFLAVMGPSRPRENPITYPSFFKPSDLESAVRAASNGSVSLAHAPAPGGPAPATAAPGR